jgi:VanZ family protein
VRRAFHYWAPLAAWMLVIFAASSRPRIPYQDDVPDWLSHATEYAVLSVLACRAFASGRPLDGRVAATVFAACIAYGVSDELHQSFVPGRHADPWDVAKDAAGTLIGLGAYEAGLRVLRPRMVRTS